MTDWTILLVLSVSVLLLRFYLFHGRLQEVALYRRALTHKDIWDHTVAGNEPPA